MKWMDKMMFGVCFSLGLIFCILGPILLFSGINPVMVSNPILEGTLAFDFELMNNGKVFDIFQTQAFDVQPLDDEDFKEMKRRYTF